MAGKPNKDWTADQREAYSKAYRAARKTKKGSPKALFGGKHSHAVAQKAANALKIKKEK